MEKEKLQISISSRMKRKIEVLSSEFGLSKEETVEFILNDYFLHHSELILNAMQNL